jgi:hypothetical protein
MSLSDKIRFMNRAEIAVPTLVAVGENGDKSRLNAKPKKKFHRTFRMIVKKKLIFIFWP